MPAEHQYMRRALDLAWTAAGQVYPRPPVGAVVVSPQGEIVGEGVTQPHPKAHAERVALEAAGECAKGGTLFCTLEPHSFHSTTPPCTDAIIEAGLSAVVVGTPDPNPKQQGRAFEVLKNAGIAVSFALPAQQHEAHRLIEGFRKLINAKTPFITAKIAMSLDGKMATKTGASQWITSENARNAGHALRMRADAILTGINTALTDDPRLTARQGDETRYPTRIILDTHAKLPPTAKLLAEKGDVILINGTQSPQNDFTKPNVERIAVPSTGDHLDLKAVMRQLAERGFSWILVESGATLLTNLHEAALIDRFEVFVAPIIIGGSTAPSPIGGVGVSAVDEARALHHIRYYEIDDNLQMSGYTQKDEFEPIV